MSSEDLYRKYKKYKSLYLALGGAENQAKCGLNTHNPTRYSCVSLGKPTAKRYNIDKEHPQCESYLTPHGKSRCKLVKPRQAAFYNVSDIITPEYGETGQRGEDAHRKLLALIRDPSEFLQDSTPDTRSTIRAIQRRGLHKGDILYIGNDLDGDPIQDAFAIILDSGSGGYCTNGEWNPLDFLTWMPRETRKSIEDIQQYLRGVRYKKCIEGLLNGKGRDVPRGWVIDGKTTSEVDQFPTQLRALGLW